MTASTFRRLLVLAGLLIFAGPGRSADTLPFLRVTAWTTSDGLPQSSVHAIAQTPDGFLWIATEGGLARFDGLEFTIFDRASLPALPSNDLCCLALDRDGMLWVGSGNGLLALDRGHALSLPGGQPFRGAAITALHPGPNGAMLVSSDAGDFLVRRNSAERLPSASTTNTTAPALTTADGTRWLGTSHGLLRITPAQQSPQPVPGFEDLSVLSLFEDRDGDLWVGTETSGLREIRSSVLRLVPGTAGLALTALGASGNSERIFLGTRGRGLLALQSGSLAGVASGDIGRDATVLSLSSSGDGTLWVGTPHGLVVLPPHGPARAVSSVDGLPDDTVRSVLALSPTEAWVGTPHGLAHLVSGRIQIYTQDNGLGGLLVGQILAARDPSTPEAVWAATEGGLSLVAPTGVIRTLGRHEGLLSPVVAAVTYDDTGELWLATDDAILWRLTHGRFQRVLQLPSPLGRPQQVLSLRIVNSTLWLQTNQGIGSASIARLDGCPAEGCADPDRILHLVTAAEGLPTLEALPFAAGGPLARPGGELWFATRGGVVAARADPSTPGAPTQPVIERLAVDERQLDPGADLRIPYARRARIDIEFAGLAFDNPRGVQFRYRLEGFDRDWIDSGSRRHATYTALPPGHYTFRVEAARPGEAWSPLGVSLNLRIDPPFYRRLWFLVLATLAVAGLLWGLVRLRLAFLRRRFGLVLAERNRLAREVHDTLAQDLVSAAVQVDVAMMQIRGGQSDRALTQLQGLRKLVSEGLAEARGSIEELRANAPELNLPARLRRLIERTHSLASVTEFRLQGKPRALAAGVERELSRIAGEALNNIARHAAATRVVVILGYTDTKLTLDLEDNGGGFQVDNPTAEEGHFGLAGMRERAETIGAALRVTSTPGEGTRVHLSVPYGDRSPR